MQVKISLLKNRFGYYSVSYFDSDKKHVHFVMKSLSDCYSWLGEFSSYQAELTFNGRLFQVWSF